MMNSKIPFERSRPRQHYNFRGSSKKSYETEGEALRYMNKHRIIGMRAYLCKECNKYHIGHYVT